MNNIPTNIKRIIQLYTSNKRFSWDIGLRIYFQGTQGTIKKIYMQNKLFVKLDGADHMIIDPNLEDVLMDIDDDMCKNKILELFSRDVYLKYKNNRKMINFLWSVVYANNFDMIKIILLTLELWDVIVRHVERPSTLKPFETP